MIPKRFLERLSNYGYRRIFLSPDIVYSIIFSGLIVVLSEGVCGVSQYPCLNLASGRLVELATQFAISLTAFILAGLAILVSFTDKEFISELKSIGIYENIMFVFQYNIYLTIVTVLLGSVIQAYNLKGAVFYIFVFVFIYMVLSLIQMIDLIVTVGNKKAEFENLN